LPDEESAQWAIKKIAEFEQVPATDSAPFFLAVGFIRPHTAHVVSQKWFDRFPLESLVLPLIKRGSKPVTIEGAHLARLQIGLYDETQTIDDGAYEVKFRVPLAAGKTRLQAWFINNRTLQGATFGVYYAGVRWLGVSR
jgi:hypothetical protein